MHCGEGMWRLGDEVVDCVVTSPPYDNLRTYQNKSDWNFDVFTRIADNLFQTMKKGGVVCWVVGDATIKGSETGTSFRQALYFKKIGFNLHDTMIYQKHNFSNPSSNRYHQIFEYIFILSKGKPKTFNPIKDVKTVMFGGTNWGKNTTRMVDGSLLERPKKEYKNEYGMRRNIWRYVTGKQSKDAKLSYLCPAPFPIELAQDLIKSWSNEGDLILDPFMGSGTTAVAAKKLNRKFIGFEINDEYIKISEERLKLLENKNI